MHLRKYNNVSHPNFALGWVPAGLVIQHHSFVAMCKQYSCNHCLLLSKPTEFGRQCSYYFNLPNVHFWTPRGASPKTEGIHIRQIPHTHVAIIIGQWVILIKTLYTCGLSTSVWLHKSSIYLFAWNYSCEVMPWNNYFCAVETFIMLQNKVHINTNLPIYGHIHEFLLNTSTKSWWEKKFCGFGNSWPTSTTKVLSANNFVLYFIAWL